MRLYMRGTGVAALCLDNLKEHTFRNKQSACIRYGQGGRKTFCF